MRKATAMTDTKGRGLIIFLKSPGNPAVFMEVHHALRSAAWMTRTRTTADPTAKTEPTTAALALVVQTAKNITNIQTVMNSWVAEWSFLR